MQFALIDVSIRVIVVYIRILYFCISYIVIVYTRYIYEKIKYTNTYTRFRKLNYIRQFEIVNLRLCCVQCTAFSLQSINYGIVYYVVYDTTKWQMINKNLFSSPISWSGEKLSGKKEWTSYVEKNWQSVYKRRCARAPVSVSPWVHQNSLVTSFPFSSLYSPTSNPTSPHNFQV